MSENEKSCRSIVFGNKMYLLCTGKRLSSYGSNADLNEGTTYGAVAWAYMREQGWEIINAHLKSCIYQTPEP